MRGGSRRFRARQCGCGPGRHRWQIQGWARLCLRDHGKRPCRWCAHRRQSLRRRGRARHGPLLGGPLRNGWRVRWPWYAGAGGFAALDPLAGSKADASPGGNTTIGVVATNADLTPADARRIAIMAQDGLARAIRPVHAPVDGDTIFVLATGAYELGHEARHGLLSALGAMAADCVARAVARAVYEAGTLGAAMSYRDRHQI
ncbi:P1 family peptidase [Parvibaculum sp.]|uniref:P1 family peptidase n=1 Tax=Parvibaculum sp. TaxID=2024848 RepID=UPI003BAC5F16